MVPNSIAHAPGSSLRPSVGNDAAPPVGRVSSSPELGSYEVSPQISTKTPESHRGSGCRDIYLFPTATERWHWSPWRQRVARILEHDHFDSAIGMVTIFNVLFMVLETNASAACEATSCSNPAFVGTGFVFLGVYTVELICRCFVFRLQAFKSRWVLLDLTVVLSGYIELTLQPLIGEHFRSNADILKLLRMAKVTRATKFLGHFPSLRAIIRGFVSAMTAMFWGGLAMVAMLTSFSILAVEILHPANTRIGHEDQYCTDAFSSVQRSLFFFIQSAIIGDQWGCIVPLILKHWYFGIIFVGVFALTQLGLMNLILTAVVDEANKAKDRDLEEHVADMQRAQEQQMALLRPVFEEIDTVGSGSLAADQILHAYDVDPRLQEALSLLQIDRETLISIAGLMDLKGDGCINYAELTKTVKEAHMQDLRMQLMTLKLQVSQLLHGLGDHVASVAQDVGSLSERVDALGPLGSKVVTDGADTPGTANDVFADLESELRAYRREVHLEAPRRQATRDDPAPIEGHTARGPPAAAAVSDPAPGLPSDCAPSHGASEGLLVRKWV